MVPVLSKQQTSTRPAMAMRKGSVQKMAAGAGVGQEDGPRTSAQGTKGAAADEREGGPTVLGQGRE